jgi:hypothetical protein
MDPTLKDLVATRQEHLFQFPAFCQSLDATLSNCGLPSQQIFHSAVVAVCLDCGLVVSGDDLFALSQPRDPERSSGRVGRLRAGDCAREGCKGDYYQIFFKSDPRLNWLRVLAKVDARRWPKAEAPPLPDSPIPGGRRSGMCGLLRRIGLCMLLLLAMLLIRQWLQGGRTAFLREPEHFHVDTVAQEERAE